MLLSSLCSCNKEFLQLAVERAMHELLLIDNSRSRVDRRQLINSTSSMGSKFIRMELL